MSSLGRIRARHKGADVTPEAGKLLAKRTKKLQDMAIHFLVRDRGMTTARAKKLLRVDPPPS